jgi:septum site-determining protein MinD
VQSGAARAASERAQSPSTWGGAFQKRGLDAVVVDADLGMANLGALLGLEHGTGLHEVLSGDATLEDAVVETAGGLPVVPGNESLTAFADADPAELGNALERLEAEYDVVLVDTQTGVAHSVAVPLDRADGVVLVATPDAIATADAGKTAALAREVDTPVTGIVLNRVRDDDAVGEATSDLSAPTLAVVPEATMDSEQPVVVTAPENPAATVLDGLAGALEPLVTRDLSHEAFDPETQVAPDGPTGTAEEGSDADDSDDEVFSMFN